MHARACARSRVLRPKQRSPCLPALCPPTDPSNRTHVKLETPRGESFSPLRFQAPKLVPPGGPHAAARVQGTWSNAPERAHDAPKHSPECARTFARMRPAVCPNTSRTFARCARTLPSMRPIRRCIVCVWLAARCCIQPPSTDIHSLGLLRNSGCGCAQKAGSVFGSRCW